MENGVGVVEEIPVQEVKVDNDRVPELQVEEKEVVGAHESKDSGGSEVFEEAIEAPLDEENDRPRPDSDDVGNSAIAVENLEEGSNEGRDDDEENTTIRVDSIVLNGREGSLTIMDDNGGVTNEDERVVGVDVDGEVEKPSRGEGSEFASLNVDDNSGVTNEELSTGDERIVDLDTGSSSVVEDEMEKPSQGEGSKFDPLNVKEIEAIDGSVEKSVVTESSVGKDEGSLVEEVKDVINNWDVENVRELGHDSVDIPSESGNEKIEEIEEMKNKDVSSSISGEIEESVGVEPEKVLRETNSEIDDGNKDTESPVLHAEHKNGGLENEVGSSDGSLSVNGGELTLEPEISKSEVAKEKVKTEDVPSDLSTQTDITAKMLSPDIVARSSNVSDEKKGQEEREVSQAKEETIVKPAVTPSTSSGKSSSSVLPPAQPAGLGRSAPLLEPGPRAAHQSRPNGQVHQSQTNIVEDTTNGEAEEGDEIREKLQMIRVKFLRLAHRLGQTPHNVVVAQVLYRLGLAEQLRARNGGRVGAFSFDRASAMAEQLEAAGQEPLDFSCTIMVLGKTGVGKSATINSIFDEVKFNTDAFQMGTKKVQDVVGTVQGIKVRVIDTPGLLTSCADQHKNEKILHSVKRFIKKSPPDIVLYLDRLDMPSRDFGDMPLLRTITEIFGPSIWFNAIVVLTHAASAPPEGPNGTVSTYDMFVTQRSHAVQQVIRQAAGDVRLMNPVSLVENHSACRTNRAGQRVLPNGQVWKPHLLLLSFASKILAEANILLKLQDTPPGKPFTARARAPPLPFLLSSLLQSRPQLKLPEEQYGDDDDDGMDDDLDETSDSDEDSAYDELPPFKPLTKAQLAKLPKAQRKAYNEELEYREKLFMKKQLKEEKRRRKMMQKMAASAKNMTPSEYNENIEEESGGAASLPVPMPDLALPASFDSDNPTHRYRYLDTSNQWLIRPVLDNHGWDHDVGYEGINLERMFAVKDKFPVSFSGQISKDKKEANLQMEVAGSVKHGEGKATTMGFDVQSVGKDMAYTLRSETRFSNYRRNKATAGLSATLIGDSLSGGLKVEDKLIINKQMRVVMSGGAMAGRGDIAYGGSFEATFRDKDYPVGRFLSTLGLSVMDWHGELALGCNIQSNFPIGRSTNMVARANLNNRGSGQVSIRLNSADQLQLALIAFLPLIRKIMGQREDQGSGY